MPSRIFFGSRPFAASGSGATQLILENDYASFVFDPDSTSGYKLSTFNRIGGHVFPNSTTELWSAEVYDTTSAPTITVSTITPTDATFTAPSITTDSQGQYISCVWTSVPVGGDALNVTVTLRLNDEEDFLRVRISASWASASTYALHSLSVMGLAIEPYHQGTDFGVVPFGFGILSEDPVQNLRYANGVPGFPVTGFGILATNTWRYPAGRGWAMAGPWGYYETQSSEAWMVYCEDWSLEVFDCTFQGDGSELTWSMRQEQPDHVLASNNGRSLGSGYTFCLRPFQITQAHGWVDMGKHYRERIDEQRPSFWVDVRPNRPDYSQAERDYSVFVDFSYQQDASLLTAGDMNTLLQSVLTNSGVPTGTKISGIIEAPNYGLDEVGETNLSDLQTQLAGLYTAGTAYMGVWFPADDPDSATTFSSPIGPNVWDHHRWNQSLGDQAELRWWTSNDIIGSLRMSRRGYLEGGGTDRLAENSSGIYYRERNYLVSAWTGPTLIASVPGTPSADFSGFTGSLYAALIPASGAARLAQAMVTAMGASTIKLYTGFFNSLGATAIPAPGDSIEVFNGVGDSRYDCKHAIINSSFLQRFENNTTLGGYNTHRSCGYYYDVHTDPYFQSQSSKVGYCYQDHSGWSKINAGYTNHPLGGGSHHKIALREWLYQLKKCVRDAQVAAGTTQFFWQTGEDPDETMLDRLDWGWHTVSSGSLWRNVVGADPTIHKYKTIPLFAVVYAGKVMGRGLNNELSTAILEPTAPYSDTELHEFLAYCLAVEWPYGITWPTLSFYSDDTIPLRDFWDNTQYASAGGAVSDTVRLIRDLWAQIVTAESTWLLDAGFRYGTFYPPGAVDFSVTDTTEGLAQSTYARFYHSYDTIYDRATFPRVIHLPWGDGEGTTTIVLVNWTGTTASWQASWNLTDLGFDSTARIRLRVVDHLNRTIEPSSTHEGAVITLGINEVPAFTVRFIVLDEEPTLTFRSRAVMVRARW